MSEGRPMRPAGRRCAICSNMADLLAARADVSQIGVSIQPGEIVLTRTGRGFSEVVTWKHNSVAQEE